jgi:hypothetical protein
MSSFNELKFQIGLNKLKEDINNRLLYLSGENHYVLLKEAIKLYEDIIGETPQITSKEKNELLNKIAKTLDFDQFRQYESLLGPQTDMNTREIILQRLSEEFKLNSEDFRMGSAAFPNLYGIKRIQGKPDIPPEYMNKIMAIIQNEKEKYGEDLKIEGMAIHLGNRTVKIHPDNVITETTFKYGNGSKRMPIQNEFKKMEQIYADQTFKECIYENINSGSKTAFNNMSVTPNNIEYTNNKQAGLKTNWFFIFVICLLISVGIITILHFL